MGSVRKKIAKTKVIKRLSFCRRKNVKKHDASTGWGGRSDVENCSGR